MKTHHTRILLAAAAHMLVVLGITPLHAQTSVTYIGPTAGNNSWTLNSNWTGGTAPTTAAFNATVNVGSVVSVPFTNINLNNFNLFGATTSGSGAIIVAGQTVIGDGASLGHAQLHAYGGITFQGSATTSLDALANGNGTAAATANWGSGTLSFIGSSVDVTNSANATWNANSGLYDSVSGTNSFANNGTFNKNTVGTLIIEPVFNQGSTGTLNVNAGELQLLGGGNHQGITNVLNDAMLTLAGTHLFAGGGFPGSFSMAAAATLNVAGGTTTIDFPYNHVGTATVASGAALNFINTGTHSGTFTPAAGGAVNFNAGTHTMTAAAAHNGAGSVNVNGGTVSLATGLALTGAGGFNVAGGTLSVAGVSSVSNPFGFTSGFVSGGGTLTIHVAATLSGSGSKQINGGTIFNVGDGIGAAGSSTADWTAGSIDIRTGGVLNIKSDGAFTTNFNGSIDNGAGSTGTMNVEAGGSFTKSGGTGTTSIATNGNSFAFNNNGTVNVQTGTLLIGSLSTGGTHTGAFDISGGANLNLAGVHTLNAGTSFTGAGTTTFSGTVTANSTVPIASPFTLTGTLNGAGPVNVTGAATWSSGFMSGAGTTNILTSLTLDTTGSKQLNTNRVLNLGDGIGAPGSTTASWTGGTLDLRTGGTMNIKADGAFSTNFNGSIDNGGGTAGTINVEAGGSFTKSGGTGTTGIGTGGNPFNFNNSGTVNVNSGTLSIRATIGQHSGSTLTGGTWNVTNGSNLTFVNGSNITTIGSAATVLLDGAGSSFAKVTTALNNNQGSFTLKNNRDLTTAGAYANSGTTRVEDSTTVMTIGTGGASAYTQTGPSSVTILAGGAMIDTSAFNLNGGALRGTGTIDGPLTATSGNATTIAPGASPGTLIINGSTVLGVNNTLAMEVGGLAAGVDYDVLAVNGVLTLGGLLDIDFINGFENSVQFTDMFTIVTSTSSILGSFSNVASGSLLATNTTWNFQVWYGMGSPYGADKVVLVSPEPSRVIFLLLGLCGVVMRRRREAGGSMQLSLC